MQVSHQRRAALEVDPGVDPGGAGDDGAELQERGPVGAVQLLQHARRHVQAGAGELVGVAGQRVDELHQQAHLVERQLRQDFRAHLEELCRQRPRLPRALVERPALPGPVGGLGDGRGIAAPRGLGAEVGPGERRRRFNQLQTGVGPLAEAAEGELLQHPGAGVEELAGGLPRAQRVARDLQAVVRPGPQLLWRQHVAQHGLGGIELLLEAGREGAEGVANPVEAGNQPLRFAMVRFAILIRGPRYFRSGTDPECFAIVRVGSGKLPIATSSVSVSRTA